MTDSGPHISELGSTIMPQETEIPSRVQFQRINLPEGQLSVRTGLPADFSSEISTLEPWKNQGEDLGSAGRRIERFKLSNGVSIVLKESTFSGNELRDWGDVDLIRQNSPTAQNEIVQKAGQKYREKYGEELPVEQLLGFYIDRNTTKRYSFYKYYDAVKPDPLTDEGEDILKVSRIKKEDIIKKLEAVGVHPGEGAGPGGTNYVIIKDDSPEGVGIILIDTEFWMEIKPPAESTSVKASPTSEITSPNQKIMAETLKISPKELISVHDLFGIKERELFGGPEDAPPTINFGNFWNNVVPSDYRIIRPGNEVFLGFDLNGNSIVFTERTEGKEYSVMPSTEHLIELHSEPWDSFGKLAVGSPDDFGQIPSGHYGDVLFFTGDRRSYAFIITGHNPEGHYPTLVLLKTRRTLKPGRSYKWSEDQRRRMFKRNSRPIAAQKPSDEQLNDQLNLVVYRGFVPLHPDGDIILRKH